MFIISSKNSTFKVKIAVVMIATQLLTACTGMAISNKQPVTLVQGPPITDIFTPFDMALACLKGQVRNDVTFSVGAILDQTGANSNMRCDSFKSHMIINKLSKFL